MDEITFDALTRSVVTGAGPRRAVMRLLAGTMLGAITSRLAPPESTTAKANSHGRKLKRTRSAPGHSPHHRRSRAHKHRNDERGAQSEGKRKGKGKKGKRRHPSPPPSPLPPGCEACNACQMCQDGACVADPELAGVPCQGSGSACNHCFAGQCTATDQPPCDDGTCAHRGSCCPGQKYCSDPLSPLGFYCIAQAGCCDGQKKCGNVCVSNSACCDADRPQCGACDTATCTNGTWTCGGACCANEKPCAGGTCVASTACCPGERSCGGLCLPAGECCAGERPCPGGLCAPAGTCCIGEKSCDGDTCVDENQCCPEEAPPVCSECEVARCVAGSWDCWPDDTCGPPCGEGFCPHGMTCHHTGTCCGTPTGGTYWTCVCASGYTGGAGCTANGQCCRQGCCYPYCCEDPRASH